MKEYFSHDYTSRTDPKIKRLIAQHGMAGYGIFWAIIEDLYVNTNVLPSDYDCIAFDLRTTPEVIDSIINDFGLFANDGTNISSTSVERRLEERKDKSTKARESANRRWKKYDRNTNVMRSQCDSNAIKEKEIKEKEIKVKKEKKVFTPPTFEEVLIYAEERRQKEIAKKFFDYFTAGNWTDRNGDAVKNWKQKFITWENNTKKPENSQTYTGPAR
jgi:hypothetical protein